jgi:hypothetical protein
MEDESNESLIVKICKKISPWLKTNLIEGTTVRDCFSEKIRGYDILTFKVHCGTCNRLVPLPNIPDAPWRQKLGKYTWVLLLGFDDHLVPNVFDNNVDLKTLLATHCPSKVSKTQIKAQIIAQRKAQIGEKVEELRNEYYDRKGRDKNDVEWWEIYDKFKEWYRREIRDKDYGSYEAVRKLFHRVKQANNCKIADSSNVEETQNVSIEPTDVFVSTMDIHEDDSSGEEVTIITMDGDENGTLTSSFPDSSNVLGSNMDIHKTDESNDDDVSIVSSGEEVTTITMDDDENGTLPSSFPDSSNVLGSNMDEHQKDESNDDDVSIVGESDNSVRYNATNMSMNKNSTQPIAEVVSNKVCR